MKEALTKCRQPGTCEPGKRSVSGYNRNSRVLVIILPKSFAKTVVTEEEIAEISMEAKSKGGNR